MLQATAYRGEEIDLPASENDVTLDQSQQVWDTIAKTIEAFLVACDTDASLPPIADFVPDAPQAVRRLALVELLKVDLEQRWSRHSKDPNSHAPLVEDYLRDFPELADGNLPCDL